MITKTNLIGLVISAMFVVFGLVLALLNKPELAKSSLFFGGYLTTFFGLIMLLAESTIVGTIYWKIILSNWILANVLPLLAILPQVKLLPIVIGTLAVYFITYVIWFLKKKEKKHLDYLKVIWVLSITVIPVSIAFKALPEWLIYSGQILLWLMIFDFLFVLNRGKKLILTKEIYK